MNAFTNNLPATRDVIDVDSVESRREAWRPAKVGLWVVGVGLGGFLLWAALAPLDEGVPAQGQVTIDTKSKAVQHQLGGIVTKVARAAALPESSVTPGQARHWCAGRWW